MSRDNRTNFGGRERFGAGYPCPDCKVYESIIIRLEKRIKELEQEIIDPNQWADEIERE